MTTDLTNTRTPDVIAAEIRALTSTMLTSVIEIGRRFAEAKAMLPHGQFGPWLESSTGYSQRTANNYMRLFEEYGDSQGSLFGASVNSQAFANLPYSKALALLAVPAEEREEFAEVVDAEGLSLRELQEKLRERDQQIADTQAAITGSIASAYWDVPRKISYNAILRLDDRLLNVFIDFEDRFM